jgi:hypothetical protein
LQTFGPLKSRFIPLLGVSNREVGKKVDNYVRVCMYLSVYLSINLSIHPSIYLSLSLSLSIYIYIYISACLCA